jgi:hypothetical protein
MATESNKRTDEAYSKVLRVPPPGSTTNKKYIQVVMLPVKKTKIPNGTVMFDADENQMRRGGTMKAMAMMLRATSC